MASILALSSAFCWGLADFLGGIQARRLPVMLVALGGQLSGALLLAILVLVRGVGPPDLELTLLALGVGLVNAVAFYSLYSALAVGNMAAVAPVLGTASLVPLIFGLATGDRPSAFQIVGSVAAITGVVLLSTQRSSSVEAPAAGNTRKGVAWALIAASCMGVTLVGIREVAAYDPYWSVLLVRLSGVVLLGGAAAITLAKWPSVHDISYAPILAIGAFDVAANALWAVASTMGVLSLVAVLGTMFPAVTVLLAMVFLHERLRSHQVVGVLLVLSGGALISGG